MHLDPGIPRPGPPVVQISVSNLPTGRARRHFLLPISANFPQLVTAPPPGDRGEGPSDTGEELSDSGKGLRRGQMTLGRTFVTVRRG
jgi:hypothetical protein